MWLIRVSPWLWLMVMSLGLAVIVWALIRRRRKFPACPKCGYDLRGTEGLTCPECGHTADSPRQLFGRPRRWAVTGLLIMLAGGHVDFVQYRMVVNDETFLNACVPTTVWIVGYPWWTDQGRHVVLIRVLHSWAVRNRSSMGNTHLNGHAGYLRCWLLSDTDSGQPQYPFAYQWQTRLLSRRAYTWFLQRKETGKLKRPDYSVTFRYLQMSVLKAEDGESYQRIINALTSTDPLLRTYAYQSLVGPSSVTAQHVPELEKLLIEELRSPSLLSPVPGFSWIQPYGNQSLPRQCEQLCMAIGGSGPRGVAVAADWLTHEPMKHRWAAVRILSYAAGPIDYTAELARHLVDVLVTLPCNTRSDELAGGAGLLAVAPAVPYLSASAPFVRENAAGILETVFFERPSMLPAQDEQREQVILEWAQRVNDPMFAIAVQTVRDQLEVEENHEARIALQRILDLAEVYGNPEEREQYLRRLSNPPPVIVYFVP